MTMTQELLAVPVVARRGAPSRGRRAGDPRLVPIALLASLVLPGLGSVLTGDVRRGVVILTGFVLSGLLLLPLGVPGVMAMFVFWLWGLVDLYDDAA
jgi:uncharacterized membrane protein YdfJ with MMPL/SSD domain